MKICSAFLVLLLIGCSSVKTYEDIIGGILTIYRLDEIRYLVSLWVPIDSPAPLERELTTQELEKAEKDQQTCIKLNEGIKYKNESFAIVVFLQCMEIQGWRLSTEEIIIISH